MENTDSIFEIEMIFEKDDSDNEVLTCQIDDKQFVIDFTKDDQAYLKIFFLTVIKELKKNKFHFKLNESKNLNNVLLLEVSREYINDLNAEIDVIYNNLQELSKLE